MNNYTYYYTYDEPIPYKNINIYPMRMKDYYFFYGLVDILDLDKNSIPDIKIIQMSYLDYLFSIHDDENKIVYKLDAILKLTMREEDVDIGYGKDDNGKSVIKIKDEFYYSDDFDEIRKIICEYNEVEMIDQSISKEVRDKIKEAEELKAKISGSKMASLEDQIVAVMISTSLSLDQIKELSIRKFSKILERVDHKLHYEIYLSASMSGMVTFKDKSFIKHWLSDLTRDRFKENTISMEDFKTKMNPVSG